MGPSPPQDALQIEVQAFDLFACSKPLAVWSSRRKQREQAWARKMELMRGASREQHLQECQEMKQRWYHELQRDMKPHPNLWPFVTRMLAEAKADRIRYKAEQRAHAEQARLWVKQQRKQQLQLQERPCTAPPAASQSTQQLQGQKTPVNLRCKQKSAGGPLSFCLFGPSSTLSDSDESDHSSHSRPRAVSSCRDRSSPNSSISQEERLDSQHSSVEYAGNTGKVPPAAQAAAAVVGPAADP